MRAIGTEFYGDDTRWFIGVVRGINDPLSLGRVRVRIFGVHSIRTDEVRDTDLPWANVIMPMTHAGISKITPPTGIQIGAQVFGVFMDGSGSQTPLILGSIPHNPKLRLSFDGPDDPSVPTTAASQVYQYNVGDEITNSMALLLEAAGERSTGQTLDQAQANSLNGVSAGSGDINIELVGESRKEQIYNFIKNLFQSRGHNNPGFVAAAFVGNFMHEAGRNLEPNKNEDEPAVSGSRGGYGLAQWTGVRRRELEKFASANNAYVGSLPLQLAFIDLELRTTHAWVFNYLINNHTIQSATETVYARYETPGIVIDFILETGALSNYPVYISKGGITAYSRNNSNQSTTLKAYKEEYDARLEDAKAVQGFINRLTTRG